MLGLPFVCTLGQLLPSDPSLGELDTQMTPDKTKRPLPSSTSMAFPEQPRIIQQWKLALQAIKLLYVRGQWKQCAARCSQLLSQAITPPLPLHATYIHFYSALSNEAIARPTHDLSTAKLYVLKEAKSSYQAAASSLPIADITPEIDDDDDNFSYITYASSDSDESEILDYYKFAPDLSTPPAYVTSPSSVESCDFGQEVKRLRTSSLCLPRSSSFVGEWRKEDRKIVQFDNTIDSFPTPPKSLPMTPTSVASPQSVHLHALELELLHSRIHERYNASLATFAELLANHTHSIDLLIQKAQEADANRYTIKRQLSFYGDEEAKASDIKARISRLKAIGWRRARFLPERYQDLCAAALAEI